MHTIRPIILNYNQPEETDALYYKLKKDGFENIIVIDNGSDLRPVPTSANLRLPWNIFSVGQSKIGLIYAMDHFPADFYWLISTSTGLSAHIDYLKGFQHSFQSMESSVFKHMGMMSVAIMQGDNPSPAFQQFPPAPPHTSDFAICYWCTYLSPIISHPLLEICRNKNSAFFEKRALRGWSVTQELIHEIIEHDLHWILNKTMHIQWHKNLGFKKSVGGESLDTYRDKNALERDTIMQEKYGVEWRQSLMSKFVSKTIGQTFAYPVYYYDAFGEYLNQVSMDAAGTFRKIHNH